MSETLRVTLLQQHRNSSSNPCMCRLPLLSGVVCELSAGGSAVAAWQATCQIHHLPNRGAPRSSVMPVLLSGHH